MPDLLDRRNLPLHAAAAAGQLEALELLLQLGAEVEACDGGGRSALQVLGGCWGVGRGGSWRVGGWVGDRDARPPGLFAQVSPVSKWAAHRCHRSHFSPPRLAQPTVTVPQAARKAEECDCEAALLRAGAFDPDADVDPWQSDSEAGSSEAGAREQGSTSCNGAAASMPVAAAAQQAQQQKGEQQGPQPGPGVSGSSSGGEAPHLPPPPQARRQGRSYGSTGFAEPPPSSSVVVVSSAPQALSVPAAAAARLAGGEEGGPAAGGSVDVVDLMDSTWMLPRWVDAAGCGAGHAGMGGGGGQCSGAAGDVAVVSLRVTGRAGAVVSLRVMRRAGAAAAKLLRQLYTLPN